MLSRAFESSRVHHPVMPPLPPGQAPRRYVPAPEEEGVLTRLVGTIEGADGIWPVYRTEPCPPPSNTVRREGMGHGALLVSLGGMVGVLLGMVFGA